MNKQAKSFVLQSNEWAMPLWLIAAIAAVLGGFSYLMQQQLSIEQFGMFTKGLIFIMLIVLTIFYKRLYITHIEISVEGDELLLTRKKILQKKRTKHSIKEITASGTATTEEMKGLIKIPQKNWILLEMKGRKNYYFDVDGNSARNLYRLVKSINPQVKVVDDILKY